MEVAWPSRCRSKPTIGELLASFAIIIVLSALLLPVFAHARAQAREAVCLGNIRSIAQAVRMYLDDNDGRFPPRETNPQVRAYFDTRPGGGGSANWNPDAVPGNLNTDPHCKLAHSANPYLRWPVIFDPYLARRDVWRCPDALLEGGATFIIGPRDWLGHLKAHRGQWGQRSTGQRSTPYLCPDEICWPAGWGGDVTDTITQQRRPVPKDGGGLTASPGMFLQSIGTTEMASAEPRSSSLAVIGDPAWWVVCADGGATTNDYCTGTLAYPDLCALECVVSGDWWGANWEGCPWSRQCGAIPAMLVDPALRKSHARHFGGVNIGFLDGHAQWFDSEQVIELSPTRGNPDRGRLRGYEPWGPTRDASWYDLSSGKPTLY